MYSKNELYSAFTKLEKGKIKFPRNVLETKKFYNPFRETTLSKQKLYGKVDYQLSLPQGTLNAIFAQRNSYNDYTKIDNSRFGENVKKDKGKKYDK